MTGVRRCLWPRNNWRWIALSLLVIAADHAAKAVILHTLPLYHSQPLLPWLSLTTMYNTGVAFSMFQQLPGVSFVVVAAVVSVGILVWVYRYPHAPALQAAGFCLILGGAVGNAIDRLTWGHVVDFIDFHVGAWHFPAFNLADSAITIGVIVLLLDMLIDIRRARRPHPQRPE